MEDNCGIYDTNQRDLCDGVRSYVRYVSVLDRRKQ
jgi:hypothetical protein